MTRFTMSIGIANPMPAFDPEGEMMAVLTPTTLPLESSSGPPDAAIETVGPTNR